jgi:site-specific DNA recombinase
MMGDMQKAVIYTRVSTDEQAKNGLSLKGQEDAAIGYCKDNNLEVAKIFCDAGESAKTINRPELIKSMAYCDENYKDIDFYIVWKMDRLARIAYDTAVIDASLQKLGIQLRSVTEPISNSPMGSLTKTMLAGFAQFDNDIRAERSSSGVKRRIKEGGWPHLSPLGYKNVKDTLGRPTLERTDVAPFIAEWLKEFLRGGYTQREMNQIAWDMGIRSKKGKRLSHQQTSNMLRNPAYAGLVYSKMIENPIRGLHEDERLIDISEHEAILEKLNSRKSAQHSIASTTEWALRGGFVKCSDCNESITGSAPKGRTRHYPIYHCSTCRAKIVGHKVSISRDKMHEQFEELLNSVAPSEATLKLFKTIVVKKWQEVNKSHIAQRKSLQKELDLLKERKQRIITLFIDGSLSLEEKANQSGLINSEILRTELELSESSNKNVSSETLIDFGVNMLTNASKLWRIADLNERQRLQIAIFPYGLTYDFVNGFRTAKTSELYEVVKDFEINKSNVVGVAGFEPATNQL